MTGQKPLSIYLHWPFCGAKCPYCDFNSHVRPSIDEPRWVAAFLRALTHWREQTPDRRVETIFWGGGTPSLLKPASIASILDHIAGLWPMAEDCEITLEANPTTHEAARFVDFAKIGVNRLSLGVQSFEQSALDFLGRTYRVADAERALAHIAETFPRYSFDLIYALPGHNLESWRPHLEYALSYASQHLSLYQLTFEPGTRFYQALQTGRMTALDDETAADLFEYTVGRLVDQGLAQYEISNFAHPGAEARHNLVYWRGGDWIGVGPGAHGRLGQGAHRHAVSNIRSPEKWLEAAETTKFGIESDTIIAQSEVAEELVLTGLRLAEGIDKAVFADVAGQSLGRVLAIQKRQALQDSGLAWETPDKFGLTPEGLMLLDANIRYLLT
jgi:putative oxygen-independent coproporphyrinogen III oxidase